MSDAATGTAAEEERPAGFLGLMRNRNYALLWSGQLVSELGNRFHWVAVSLWVYSKTGSAAAVSLAISSMFVGGLFVSLWAGVLVDRLNRKTIMIFADLARVLLVALIPTLMGINIWLVYADLALVSVATAFFRPAIFAVVPQVVSRRSLLPANSFFSAMDTGTEIVGPAMAGVLAYKYGYPLLLYVDATTYGISALCILAMSVGHLRIISDGLNFRGVYKGILEGLRYIRTDRLQWALFILLFPAALVGAGLNALQTPLAKGTVGITDLEFGTFQGVWGIGFVIASLLLGWFGAQTRRSVLIIGGFFLTFIATGLMGLSTTFQVLLMTAFGVGFANTLYYVGLSTVIMEHSPQDVIGRVIATRQVALSAVRVFSPVFFGVLADGLGIKEAIVAMAAFGFVGTAVVVAVMPAVRLFDARPERPNWKLLGRFWGFVTQTTDDEFDKTQQARLNMISVSVVFIAWLGLCFIAPLYALVLVIAIPALSYLGILARRSGWLP